MAKKNINNQGKRINSDTTSEMDDPPVSSVEQRALAGRKAVIKNELVRAPKQPKSLRKTANPTLSNSVLRKSPMSNKSSITINRAKPISVQTKMGDSGNNSNILPGVSSSQWNTSSKIAVAVSVLLAFFVLFFCVLPLKQVSYEVPVVYQDIEVYTEMEPYTETVYYSETEPYTTTEAYVVTEPYVVNEPYMPPMPPPPPPSDNTTIPFPHPPFMQYHQVMHYSTVTRYRDVVRYKEVEKSRLETKFKPVQKQRTVTKVRQETRYKMVPVLYSMIDY